VWLTALNVIFVFQATMFAIDHWLGLHWFVAHDILN
jgi:hypothetical protein